MNYIQQNMYTQNKQKARRKYFCKKNQDAKQSSFHDLIQLPFQNFHDKENAAKQILFQVGNHDPFSSFQNIKKVCPSIDRWIMPLTTNSDEGQKNKLSQMIARNAQSVQTEANRRREVVDENNIFKLKEALKKLESPEKLSQSKNRKTQILQSINKKRSKSTKVADLVRSRDFENQQCSHTSSVVIRMAQTYRKYRSNRPSFFQLNRCENFSDVENVNLKEARKNRTLKSILQ